MKICSKKIELSARAKINLSLYINGVRSDGYHLLDSVFVPISLSDKVTLMQASGIKLFCGGGIPCDGRNTAYKAAELMMEAFKIKGAHIEIEKNIPHMAGLGGASADAAAVLIGINMLYGLNLSNEELKKFGLKIGADVPFFLGEGAARVQGIGEIMTPVGVKGVLHLVILKPECSLSTPAVYKKYDEIGTDGKGSSQDMINALEKGDLALVGSALHNSMMPAAQLICPEIESYIDYLKESGAMAAQMTGSGSCVFGIFETQESAEYTAQRFDGKGSAFTAVTCQKPIVKSP